MTHLGGGAPTVGG